MRRRFVTVCALFLAMGFTVDAFAQGPEGVWSRRGITAPQGTLVLLAGPTSQQALSAAPGPFGSQQPGISHHILPTLEIDLGIGTFELDLPDFTLLSIGAAYGITNELEVGLYLPTFVIWLDGGDADFIDRFDRQIPLFTSYSILDGDFSLAGRVGVNIPFDTDRADFSAVPGVQGSYKIPSGRIDFGLFAPITLVSASDIDDEGNEVEISDTQVDISIPVRFGYNINLNMYAGLGTGINLNGIVSEVDFDFENATIPLNLFFGYTIPGASVIDVALQAGAADFRGVIDSERLAIYVISLGAVVQLGLM